jgi:hypothetical protein
MYDLTDSMEAVVPADFFLSKQIAEILDKAYPGHLWGVNVDGEQGIARVFNLRLSGQWGFILHLSEMKYQDEIQRNALQAGGELLERYRLARGRYNQDEYSDLHQNCAGLFTPDA